MNTQCFGAMFVATALSLLAVDETQKSDQHKELAAICDQAKRTTGFSFTMKIEELRAGRSLVSGLAGPEPIEGQYSLGLPIPMKVGTLEVYRDGRNVLVKEKGVWRVFNAKAARRGDGNPKTNARCLAFKELAMPSMVLARFGSEVASVARRQEGETLIYSGTLNERGARVYSGAGRIKEAASRSQREVPELSYEGHWTLRVIGGVVESLELRARRRSPDDEEPVERITRLSIRDFNAVKLVIPDEVLACIRR